VSSINVVLSPPKPAEKSSLGVKREEENVGDVKKRRHETADNDGGKSLYSRQLISLLVHRILEIFPMFM
jgi:hypothetical protein